MPLKIGRKIHTSQTASFEAWFILLTHIYTVFPQISAGVPYQIWELLGAALTRGRHLFEARRLVEEIL